MLSPDGCLIFCVFAFSGQLNVLQDQLDSLVQKLKRYVVYPLTPCACSEGLEPRVNDLKTSGKLRNSRQLS